MGDSPTGIPTPAVGSQLNVILVDLSTFGIPWEGFPQAGEP